MGKNQILGNLKSYFLITLGLFINAFAWTAFLIPSKVVGGGISGLGTIIFYATGFPVGFTVLSVNAVLILLAIKFMGAKFGINTIYGIVMISIFLSVLQQFIHEPLVNDKFMATLIGAMLAGLGVGVTFANGGNTGGTDIIALIITQYRNISPGRVIMLCDVLIIATSYLISYSIETVVYGYVMMGVCGYTIDMILEGAKQSYQFMIFSDKNTLIADRITAEVGRGVTALKGYGWFNKQEKEILIVIGRKNDKYKILRIIYESDPKAFITVDKVMGVFGLNFDKIKI